MFILIYIFTNNILRGAVTYLVTAVASFERFNYDIN